MSFDRLLQPDSIAVFGGGVAEELVRQCDRLEFAGEIWPVHPKKEEIRGRKVYRSVEDLPGSPDAAYVGVNRNLTIDIVRDLAARDAGGAICYATGFAEAGEEGSQLAERLLEASGEMPLVGPNCYGLLNYLDGAVIWPDQQGGRRVDRGVAIITASSNVAFNLSMQRRGLPIAYMMSLGNKLKFDLHDAIRAFAQQDRVTALGLYLEAMSDPRAFEDAINLARELGKPIVAVKTGRSEVAQKIVVSHTASLAGSDALVSALFDMSTSGGDLTLIADAMIGTDLTMPQLTDDVTNRLRSTVHERMVAANPLDFQMFDWNNADRLADTFSAFISDDLDVSLCLLDYPREDLCDQSTWDGAEQGFVRAVHHHDAKGAVLSTFSDTISEKVAARLIDEGIAPLAGVDAGIAAVQAAVEVGAAWRRPANPPLLTGEGLSGDLQPRVLDEVESKAILGQCGVRIPPSRVVRDAREAVAAAEELGYPVVVKALDVAHKTDVGGVRLDLGNADDVSAAVTEMSDLSESYLIEKMVDGVVAEIIVGVARDEQFGPYLLVGGGGILVEVMRDSASLLLPVSRERVIEALGELKCAPLLQGFRGSPRADLDAAADAILAIAAFVEKDPTAIAELDINPLMLLAEGQGVVAADALVSLRGDAANHPSIGAGSARRDPHE
jgi:acyl-CoA synthetase (NDP forming)